MNVKMLLLIKFIHIFNILYCWKGILFIWKVYIPCPLTKDDWKQLWVIFDVWRWWICQILSIILIYWRVFHFSHFRMNLCNQLIVNYMKLVGKNHWMAEPWQTKLCHSVTFKWPISRLSDDRMTFNITSYDVTKW